MNYSALDASIGKISVPIIKRRSWGFQNTPNMWSLPEFKPSYRTSKKAMFWLSFSNLQSKFFWETFIYFKLHKLGMFWKPQDLLRGCMVSDVASRGRGIIQIHFIYGRHCIITLKTTMWWPGECVQWHGAVYSRARRNQVLRPESVQYPPRSAPRHCTVCTSGHQLGSLVTTCRCRVMWTLPPHLHLVYKI